MADRRGQSPEHAALAQLRAYWEGLREGNALPTRAQIDPRGIERALEYAFIAERVAPGVARFRLAGMHLNDLMGMEVRGMPLTTLFEPVARDEVARQIERAFVEPASVDLRISSARAIGRPALSARMLLLPLRNEAGQVARVLGGLATEGAIGRPPRQFRLSGAEAAACGAQAQPPELPDLTVPAEALGLAEAAAAFEGPDRAPGRGHLRLVYSSDKA